MHRGVLDDVCIGDEGITRRDDDGRSRCREGDRLGRLPADELFGDGARVRSAGTGLVSELHRATIGHGLTVAVYITSGPALERCSEDDSQVAVVMRVTPAPGRTWARGDQLTTLEPMSDSEISHAAGWLWPVSQAEPAGRVLDQPDSSSGTGRSRQRDPTVQTLGHPTGTAAAG